MILFFNLAVILYFMDNLNLPLQTFCQMKYRKNVLPVLHVLSNAIIKQGAHGTGKTGKMAKKILSRKTQGIWKFCQNTGITQAILLAQVRKCSDSKSKGYCDSCHKRIHFFPEAG